MVVIEQPYIIKAVLLPCWAVGSNPTLSANFFLTPLSLLILYQWREAISSSTSKLALMRGFKAHYSKEKPFSTDEAILIRQWAAELLKTFTVPNCDQVGRLIERKHIGSSKSRSYQVFWAVSNV